MTSRERVKAAITFSTPDRIPYELPPQYGTDVAFDAIDPSPDIRHAKGVDEWGCVWDNIGDNNLGEVKQFPLSSWDQFDSLEIPDIKDPNRYTSLKSARQRAGDKFLVGFGSSLYERVHFLRGLENAWMDIYDEPERLGALIDILADMNCYVLEKYADADFDGIIWPDDWGLQDKLMIDPNKWREIWKPRYQRVWEKAHELGMHTLLHSCGYIVDILPDMIAAGLDVIQMDQQENMGLDNLGEQFRGKITFFNPVDIQNTMARGNPEEIRQYCRTMIHALGTPEGGFIAKWYPDPQGAGHTAEALDAMSTEFVKLSTHAWN